MITKELQSSKTIVTQTGKSMRKHVFAVLYNSPFAQTMTNDHEKGRGSMGAAPRNATPSAAPSSKISVTSICSGVGSDKKLF